MGKFDGVLLASDYDDTLYNTQGTVSEGNKKAIRYFMAEGGRFSVATGRAHRTFTPQIQRENIPFNAPCVLSNGSVVYDYHTETWLRKTLLRDQAPMDMAQLVGVIPSLGVECYHEDDIYVYHPNAVTTAHMERVNVPFVVVDRLDQVPNPWIKTIIEDDHPKLLVARDYILDHWGDHYEAIFSNNYLLEVTRKGSHKGGMVTWLAQHLGIDRDHIYCVGDNANDLPMLAISKIPFAPENCTQALKDWGATILPHTDDDTIAALIQILDKRY